MLSSELQKHNHYCQLNLQCHCFLSIFSSGTERIIVTNTSVSRQYVQCRRRRKQKLFSNNMTLNKNYLKKHSKREDKKLYKKLNNQSSLIFFKHHTVFTNQVKEKSNKTSSSRKKLKNNLFTTFTNFSKKDCFNHSTKKINILFLLYLTIFCSNYQVIAAKKNFDVNEKINLKFDTSNLIDYNLNDSNFDKKTLNFKTFYSNELASTTSNWLINEKIDNFNNQTSSAQNLNRDAFKNKINQFTMRLTNFSKFTLPFNYEKSKFLNRTNKLNKKLISQSWLDSAYLKSDLATKKFVEAELFPNSILSKQNFFANALVSDNSFIKESNNSTVMEEFKKNQTIFVDNYLDSLNYSDNTYLKDDFLQPFTNITWWTRVPYPRSGYSQLSIVILAFLITIIMMLVVIGNLLVCIAICTEKSLKTIQNWFIASLAVSDLLLGLIIMPFSLAYELMGYWIFGRFWCEVHHALDVLLTTASINNLCLISLDRYWSVTQAIEYLKKRTPCRAIFMIAFAWVFSAVVCLPPLVGWKKENQKPGECELSDDFGYVLYSSLGSFYIPCVVMVFVYAKIFVAARSRARKHVRKKQISTGSLSQDEKKNNSQVLKTAHIKKNQNDLETRPLSITNDVYNANNDSSNVQLNKETNEKETKLNNSLSKKQIDSVSNSSAKYLNSNRVPFGRFARRAQLESNSDQELDDNSEIHLQNKKEYNLNKTSNQINADNNVTGNNDKQVLEKKNSNKSDASPQSSPLLSKKNSPTVSSIHLITEDFKKSGTNYLEEKIQLEERSATTSSKVTFSPNNIVFNLNSNSTQPISTVPQIVIHGSMQQLNLPSNVKRSRFINTKLNDSDFNNNQNTSSRQKRFGHPTITGTLSAGHLDCVILETSFGLKELTLAPKNHISKELVQSKKPSLKKHKVLNNKEIDSNTVQHSNQHFFNSPQSILKPCSSTNSSLTTLTKINQQIELQEKIKPSNEQNNKEIVNINCNSDEMKNLKAIEDKKSSLEITDDKVCNLENNTQDNKLNYLGVNSLQNDESVSCSMVSINYDFGSKNCLNDKNCKKRSKDTEFDFDDENENESSFTNQDENASKKSLKCSKHSKKKGFFSHKSWFAKWMIINETCINNEDEYTGYEEDDEEEEDVYFEDSTAKNEKNHETPKSNNKKKKISKKNHSKANNSSIISANNTSSSGTYGSNAAFEIANHVEKKSNSLLSRLSRFSRNSSNKSTSSSNAKKISSNKQRGSSRSTCSVAAISQSSSSSRQHKDKSSNKSNQIQAHSKVDQSISGTQYSFQASDADRQKRKIAKAREKRATLILGLIMGAFILGYIPFFGMYLLQGICQSCNIQSGLTFSYWIGYCNSAINPIIYTVFNRDFRKAFRKILFR